MMMRVECGCLRVRDVLFYKLVPGVQNEMREAVLGQSATCAKCQWKRGEEDSWEWIVDDDELMSQNILFLIMMIHIFFKKVLRG
jgi:hypothetical protein